MELTPEKKKELFKEYNGKEDDTGSPEGQIVLFTKRIEKLTDHLKRNKKDKNTQRSLVKIVGKRRSLLNYLQHNDVERYRAIVSKLGLRK